MPFHEHEELSIKERLEFVYGKEDAKKAYIGIKYLTDKYIKKVDSQPYSLTQKDIILIAYGNQVVESDEAPLDTFQKFLRRYVGDSINTIHILPFYPYSSDDGFSVANYYEVCPQLGSWREVKKISSSYRLMFDAVLNHVSRYSYWFKQFLAGDERYKDYFIEMDPITDTSSVVRPRETPLLTPFEDDCDEIHYIWTTFSKDQVDINYKNYQVFVKIIDVLLFYVERGAKLIRLDAIAFLWKQMGTGCVNLPQTHQIIQMIRDIIHKVAPEIVIITEANVPHVENVSYFGSGDDEAQMVYNFTLPPLLAYSIVKGDTKALSKWADELEVPSHNVCFLNFTASHDGIGLRPVMDILPEKEINFLVENTKKNGGEVSFRVDQYGDKKPYELNCNYMDLLTSPQEEDSIRIKRMLLSQAVVLAMPGVPGIYFHSLVGSRNYHQGLENTGLKRSINRQKIFWKHLKKSLDSPCTEANIIFSSYKKLISIRINEKAFNPFGPFSFPNFNNQVFAVKQTSIDAKETILAFHNFSPKKITVTVPEYSENGINLLNRKEIKGRELTLEGYEIAWIKSFNFCDL